MLGILGMCFEIALRIHLVDSVLARRPNAVKGRSGVKAVVIIEHSHDSTSQCSWPPEVCQAAKSQGIISSAN